ncbi:putative F-box domain-containing protein [Helianthus annuus]|uniref:F-box domain-containing protein n=1 Tax=Helianthus annuus TaxID=4232 RepID=A0A251SHL3_HELAN|nr:putative F-box protein At3g16210 [Helianthus annuus]KAF5764853.1 putative F-box domain-containing protein [Helianthus annuus]KAJ0451481.1 putative F-box domain-containing protein [Helianthus annuus]KAJ0456015.1 putative F-box domain-containing protein [Helianthus annuus]KAJ0473360.1 putative F-box domain-containing protein [Helianthus annuus]KAJ0648943.1 putative F-box domain-containing protein [Helianthus annuus]
MSDHIPFDIQSEIMKMLPVKSLLRFRSICKQWKSLIQSSDFIAHYRSQQHHLLVSYHDYGPKYVSIADDHTSPQQKVSLTSSVNKMLEYPPRSRIISSCHGLVCFYCNSARKAVIWNISLRKTVTVAVPTLADDVYVTILGFGVCRETSDPKIVKITYIYSWSVDINATCIPSQVDATLRGFRKSGEPVIAIPGERRRVRLAVYEPYSKRIDYLGIDGSLYSFKVYPYMEILFLLDQPDNMVYSE